MSETATTTDYDETLQEALDLWGKELQIDVAIEELSELITELARIQRGTRSHASNEHLVDELADVEIIHGQLKRIVGPGRVESRKAEKAERLRGRIEDEYESIERASDQ